MFNRFKSAIYNVVGSFDPGEGGSLGNLQPGLTAAALPPTAPTRPGPGSGGKEKGLRFPYTRPHFLQLNTEDEIQVTADHAIRPIICPRDISRLPWNSGFAETINAGKSKRNEDQAVCHNGLLKRTIKRSAASEVSGEKQYLMNGHDNPHEQEYTVKLVPQGRPNLGSSISSNSSNTTSDTSTTIPSLSSDLESGHEATSIIPEPNTEADVISCPYYIFGVFDGHAGWGAAISASNQLHHIIHEKLVEVVDIILPDPVGEDRKNKPTGPLWAPERELTTEHVVTGALEQAFWQMDNIICEDRLKYQLNGGCTACVALFIKGKLYVANAGDSRCILSYKNKPREMSYDFTPETETQRVRKLGAQHPELLGGEYTHLDFLRRPMKRDLGKRVFYRDHYMTGWAYKTLTQDDLKYPLVCGEGKRSRVLATIGVTRGFGDHDLKAQYSSLPIKPFLSPEPEVRIFDVAKTELNDGDVLVLATDGLWDIASNEKVVRLVEKSLNQYPIEDTHRYKYRYTGAAQDLVMSSRGKLRDRNWRTSEDKHATIDDISVFVVPIRPYQQEYNDWEIQQQTKQRNSVSHSEEQEYLSSVCNSNSQNSLIKEPTGSEYPTSVSNENSAIKDIITGASLLTVDPLSNTLATVSNPSVDPLSLTESLPSVDPLSSTESLLSVDPLLATETMASVEPLTDSSVSKILSSEEAVSTSQLGHSNEKTDEDIENTQSSVELNPQENYFMGEEELSLSQTPASNS